jgi:hypothetical protein
VLAQDPAGTAEVGPVITKDLPLARIQALIQSGVDVGASCP